MFMSISSAAIAACLMSPDMTLDFWQALALSVVASQLIGCLSW
jgi:hypothetical protein